MEARRNVPPTGESICLDLFGAESVCRLYTDERIEIGMIVKGSGIHRILDKEIPCREGDLYIIPANLPHGYYFTEEASELAVKRIFFDPVRLNATESAPSFCSILGKDGTRPAYAMLNTTTKEVVSRLFDSIEYEITHRASDWQTALSAHVTLLLITLSRYVEKEIKNLPHLDPRERELAALALQTVAQSFGDSTLTLEGIAAQLYVSPSQLSRLFKKMTAKSFSEYLRDTRVSHACELLRDTSLTVERIIEACGLRDRPSFYHAFHVYTGLTPHQYRTQEVSKQNQKRIGEKIMSILNEMSENLQKGRAKLVKELVEKALAEGCDPADILNEGLLAGMSIVGEKFKNNEVYVPEVLVAARAMNTGVSVLKPHLIANGITATGKVCIGTVQGDLHDIGKNLVKMMMEGKGLEVVDLGVDVPAEKFVQAAIDEGCRVICCSALLTTTMSVMADVVKAAEAAGIRDQVKIMIGGAPVTDDFRREIGADAYTTDAASAADAAANFCK